MGLPGEASDKEPACQCRRHKRHGFDPWVGKIPWRRAWQPTPIFLPGESHWQRILVSCSPLGHKELDTIEATLHAQPWWKECSVLTSSGGTSKALGVLASIFLFCRKALFAPWPCLRKLLLPSPLKTEEFLFWYPGADPGVQGPA